MAEGLLRALYGDRYEAHSAGIEAQHRLILALLRLMEEIGIDISNQHSKRIDGYRDVLFDLAVIVCDKAKEACPICGISLKASAAAPAAKKAIYKTFNDPAIAEGSEDEQLNVFRQVRDEIRRWITENFH